jgi:hypothetical protein
MLTSIPINPAQPDQAFYTVGNLYTLQQFDRIACPSAPTYDGTRKMKTWKDDSVTGQTGNVSYTVITAAGASQITMPASEAATLNLYGIETYPPYVIAPTDATVLFPGMAPGSGPGINPNELSMQADAIVLAVAFGLTAAAVTDGGAGLINYPADEQRRMWVIAYKGYQLCAGLLLAQANAFGVGAPGHWNLTGSSEPLWANDTPTSLPPQSTAWNIPCRPLLSNEKIAVNPFAGFMIYRTDMTSVYNPAPSAWQRFLASIKGAAGSLTS